MKKLLIVLMFVVVLSGCKSKNTDLSLADIIERTNGLSNVTLFSESGESGIAEYTTTINYDSTDIRYTNYDGEITFYVIDGDEYVLLSETVSSQIYRGLVVTENYYPSIASVLENNIFRNLVVDDFIKDGNSYSLQSGDRLTLVKVNDDNYITSITRVDGNTSIFYSLTLSDFGSTDVSVPEYIIPD